MLYFILHPRRDAVKIGYSADPEKRVRGIQGMTPDCLLPLGVCPGDRDAESAMHRRFDHLRIRGEWFRNTPELRAVIEELCEGYRLWGRCPRCGAVAQDLHENIEGTNLVCAKCDPPGLPRSLRRSREAADCERRIPAGGGYRLLRKGLK